MLSHHSFFLCFFCEQLADDTEQQVGVRVWAGELRRAQTKKKVCSKILLNEILDQNFHLQGL